MTLCVLTRNVWWSKINNANSFENKLSKRFCTSPSKKVPSLYIRHTHLPYLKVSSEHYIWMIATRRPPCLNPWNTQHLGTGVPLNAVPADEGETHVCQRDGALPSSPRNSEQPDISQCCRVFCNPHKRISYSKGTQHFKHSLHFTACWKRHLLSRMYCFYVSECKCHVLKEGDLKEKWNDKLLTNFGVGTQCNVVPDKLERSVPWSSYRWDESESSPIRLWSLVGGTTTGVHKHRA